MFRFFFYINRMKGILPSYGLLFLTAFFVGCGKDDASRVTPTPVTMSEALKGNKWQLNSLIVYEPANTPILNLTTISFRPCELDNYFTFSVDNIFREVQGGQICITQRNSKFYLMSGGPWLLNENDSTLTIGGGFIFETFKVVEASNNKMRWEQVVTNYLGGKQIYEYTLRSVK